MKRIVLFLSLAALLLAGTKGTYAQEPTPNVGPWFIATHASYVVRGAGVHDVYMVGDVGRQIMQLGQGRISVVFQAIDIENTDAGGYGMALMWAEPTFIPHVDFLARIGGANKLDVGTGEKDWGLITGAGLNVHMGERSMFFGGLEAMQRESGPLDTWSLTFGAALAGVDDVFGKLWGAVRR